MTLPILSLTQKELSVFESAIQKEWLITNGLGGYASSTVLGVNTRKYHGLLVAALHPPGDRTVCLSKLDEEINVDDKVYLLGTNEFYGAVFPQGYLHMHEFSVSPFPKFTYEVEQVVVEKTVFMPRGKNACVVVYEISNRGNSKVKVNITPLITCRHYHSVVNKSVNPPVFSQQNTQREVQITFKAPIATVAVRATTGEFHEKLNWIERLRYREDENRRENGAEDCYQPGGFEIMVQENTQEVLALIAVADEDNQQTVRMLDELDENISEIEGIFHRKLQRQKKLLADFYLSHPTLLAVDWLSWVRLAADAFQVRDADNQKSVIAGYHWYEPWGRDTFISLPGLMLVTGRFEEAKSVLSRFNAYCKQGLIPNYFHDKSGKAAYNTVDATLWFVNAVLHYLKYTGDFEFVRRQLWENLKDIVESHLKGTAFGIHVDSDGLLAHGEQLTWMDAKVDHKAITPRAGKAVEIQALWYNALKTVQMLASRFEENGVARRYSILADKTKESFNEKFWNNKKNCLFDVLMEYGADASLRPNQAIVAALDFVMLDQKCNMQILDVVQQELLTPCGLRTLESNDPKYRGTYYGDRYSRDNAYHNGTVWPWLLGPFTTAYLKAKNYSGESIVFVKNLLESFFTLQVSASGLGTVNEIFDGDAPHAPRGCIAQAWSVAEPLRAYVEDVLKIRPLFERRVLGV